MPLSCPPRRPTVPLQIEADHLGTSCPSPNESDTTLNGELSGPGIKATGEGGWKGQVDKRKASVLSV